MKKTNNSQNLENPQTKYYHSDFSKQKQPWPGLDSEMNPIPDCGEKSYVGHNRLKGRKVLITGGDSGIGRAVAIAYAREGADIAINYLPSEEKDALEVKKYIEDAGHKAVLIPGDVSDENFCKKLVLETLEGLGDLDTLVLNAGQQQFVDDIENLTTEQFRKTFETNLFSMFWIVKAALPYLKPGSNIITTSSIQAYQPGKILLDYAASKSAIIAFTRALANQLITKGIRANAVAPGPIWTALQISGGQPQEKIPAFGQNTLMKRAGQPVELSGVYVLLASNESSFTTAEVYGVTGGMHTS